MPDELTFRTALLALYLLFAATRIYYGLKVLRSGGKVYTNEREAVEREGRFSSALGTVMEFVMPASVLLYVLHPAWVAGLALPLPVPLRLCGVALSLACLFSLVRIHRALGEFWSTALRLRDGHRLITTGPYARVRHPMYTAIFANMLGYSLASANLVVILPRVVQFLHLHSRIGSEEAMMLERFGDDYRAYAGRTGRLLPRLFRRNELATEAQRHGEGQEGKKEALRSRES